MPWNDELDPATAAYQIAANDAIRIRVLAGPGTGKSFAIKRRITRLLEEGVEPRRVLAVTFTRMSASDLIRDVRSLEVPGAEDVVARTLHAECFRILGKNAVIEITNRHPRPLSPFELAPLLEDLRPAAGGRNRRDIRSMINDYESAWARLQHEVPGAPPTDEARAFERALVSWLQFHRAMLIGELVPFAYQYLRDNPAAPERAAYDHVLVDEYQDLNRAEQEVAALLASDGTLLIVGDDDQSIYTFKNAHRTGIIEFPDAHPGTLDHTMDDCRRCPALVVSMANSLIRHNTQRPEPARALVALDENGPGVVEVFQFAQHELEIEHLAQRIQEFIEADMPPGQIIVLSQSRKYARPLFDRLRQGGVPAEFCYQESQLDDEHATERMAMLKLAGDPEDRVCLRFLTGLGSASWRSNQWSRIRGWSEQEGESPYAILTAMAGGSRPDTNCTHIVARFREIQAELGLLQEHHGADLLRAWLPDDEVCVELREIAADLLEEDGTLDAAGLADAILDVIEQPEVPDQVTDVRIMSLHKSKGLSANVVIIMGCVEGVLPRHAGDQASPQQVLETVEESRRLFFVGLTRVKASPAEGRPGHLLLSSSRQVPTAIAMQSGIQGRPGRFGAFTTVASRFMRELGPDCPATVTPV